MTMRLVRWKPVIVGTGHPEIAFLSLEGAKACYLVHAFLGGDTHSSL
ncbi:MAG: hypothetical protein ACN6ON_07755 [Sphingobacterium sp.]